MGLRFEDSEHLFRMAGLYVLGTLGLLALRGLVVPSDFGLYGHYRAGALTDNATREIVYAGRETCEACHDDIAKARLGGGHELVACEACHGPLAAHAASPEEEPTALPRLESLCLDCHQSNASKPQGFPQIDEREHAQGEACGTCHDPHHPGFE